MEVSSGGGGGGSGDVVALPLPKEECGDGGGGRDSAQGMTPLVPYAHSHHILRVMSV